MENIQQPNLFDETTFETEKILMFALGEFQARGKVLAERELPLDRLRGAFKRATDKFGVPELSDEDIAEGLKRLNARVIRVPSFVAKHPFRVTVNAEISQRSAEIYKSESAKETNIKK